MVTPAKRKFKKAGLTVMAGYFVVFIVTMFVVDRIHPTGWVLYCLAALPSIPIFTVFVLAGQYLASEKDEFSRDLMVRTLLWGTAASMSITMFVGFMRIFGWQGRLPAFTEFYAFAVFAVLSKISYRVSNPLPADE